MNEHDKIFLNKVNPPWFAHIYREINGEVDELSKKVVGPLEDFFHFKEILDGVVLDRRGIIYVYLLISGILMVF